VGTGFRNIPTPIQSTRSSFVRPDGRTAIQSIGPKSGYRFSEYSDAHSKYQIVLCASGRPHGDLAGPHGSCVLFGGHYARRHDDPTDMAAKSMTARKHPR
jgi:hypothetical protein